MNVVEIIGAIILSWGLIGAALVIATSSFFIILVDMYGEDEYLKRIYKTLRKIAIVSSFLIGVSTGLIITST